MISNYCYPVYTGTGGAALKATPRLHEGAWLSTRESICCIVIMLKFLNSFDRNMWIEMHAMYRMHSAAAHIEKLGWGTCSCSRFVSKSWGCPCRYCLSTVVSLVVMSSCPSPLTSSIFSFALSSCLEPSSSSSMLSSCPSSFASAMCNWDSYCWFVPATLQRHIRRYCHRLSSLWDDCLSYILPCRGIKMKQRNYNDLVDIMHTVILHGGKWTYLNIYISSLRIDAIALCLYFIRFCELWED